ncbi:MAG TPA: carbohydrate porin, partial [Pirellulales bacterium]|nr:carbohydrate porin [Pirellulales bacterium]
PTRSPAWTATWRFDQVVRADPANPLRNWTLNGDFGLSDGNPNPIHWFANIALVANGPIRGREHDLFGIGYYHLGVSGLPVLEALGLSAENGFEVFYDAAVTPSFRLTPDLQVLNPARRGVATAVLIGVRARLSF